MAQQPPSRLLYAQAIQMIKKLQQIYSTTKNQTPQSTSENINSILTKFSSDAGTTLTEYDPVYLSEVPLSAKMNKFWISLQDDINILQDEVDILSASMVYSHNFVKTEILKARKENGRLQNKIKTLEMYSAVDNSSLVYFGDAFLTEDFIDWNLVDINERASLLSGGYMSLKISKQSSVFDKQSKISILSGSNGFKGNNQEILDPSNASINPANGQKMFTFVSEFNRSADLSAITDDKPDTWFEFEKYFIPVSARVKAKNLNFEYNLTDDAESSYLVQSLTSTDSSTGVPINWANGIENDVLKLSLEIDLRSNKQINVLTLLPFGLTDNINNPIKITQVATSLNHTDWTVLTPENVWVSNSINKQISNINAENILIGSATWVTDGQTIRYVRVQIEQVKPIACNIGHIYYVSKDGPAVNTPNYNVEYPIYDIPKTQYNQHIPYNSPVFYGSSNSSTVLNETGYDNTVLSNAADQTVASDIVDDLNYRVLGPNPPVKDPQLYMNLRNSTLNGLIQKREFFIGKRWAIGLRDISIIKNVYGTKGVIVSKRFDIPGIVDRVSLEADISIPNGYDTSLVWINFYISPDDGLNWYQISRIQDDFLNIPEIIAFNDPTPMDLRESGIAYYDIKTTVNSLRVKIEINRPESDQNSTPIVRSYKLKVIKRD